MKKLMNVLLALVLVIGLFAGCQAEDKTVEEQSKGQTEKKEDLQEKAKDEKEEKKADSKQEKLQVAVSIVPQAAFVEAVAGDLVDVVTMIPAGSSPANYQPSPKEMTAFSQSKVYFSIGVPTEKANILPNIADMNKEVKIVDLAKIVDAKHPARNFVHDDHYAENKHHDDDKHDHKDDHHDDDKDDHKDDHHDDDKDDHKDDHHDDDKHDHKDDHHDDDKDDHKDDHHDDDKDDHKDDHHDDDKHDHKDDHHDDDKHDHKDHHHHSGRDPHIWMSPKRVIVMVEAIRDELVMLDESNAETYKANAQAYVDKLSAKDKKLAEKLKDVKQKTFIIMHPSMGYFADDYGLKMIGLEQHGKEATATHLQEVIEVAKEKGIKVVFYQAEFDSQQARTLAEEIKGTTQELKPLSPDYLKNLDDIEAAFMAN